MKENVGSMKKYAKECENMREYVGDMKKYEELCSI